MASPSITTSSRALVMIGDKPISSLSGSGASAVACSTLYPSVVEDLLSRYRWRFASKIVALQRLAAEPLSRFAAAYQLPSDVEQSLVYAVSINGNNAEFERFGSEIHVDADTADTVYAEVKYTPNETKFPSYFRALVELELAAKLAITLAEDAQKASYFEGKALRQFGLAKNLDSQTQTARKIRLGGLRRYHGGRA